MQTFLLLWIPSSSTYLPEIKLLTIQNGLSFDLMYILTLVLGAVMLLFTSWKRRQNYSNWITISATVIIFFIIGLKLYSYPIGNWKDIFLGNYSNLKYIKYAPSGLLFVVIILPLIKRLLRVRISVIDPIVLFLPMMQIIQRTGCLMNGCCHGKSSTLPWAVSYPAGTVAHTEQLRTGLITPENLISSSVHPTQLYTIAGCFIVMGLVWIFRRRFSTPGNLTLFTVCLIALVRFVVEFWREPKTNAWYSNQWLGVTQLQFTTLLFISICILIMLYKARKGRAVPVYPPEMHQPFFNLFLLYFCLLSAGSS